MSWGAHGTIVPTDKQCFFGVNTACAASRASPRGVAYEETQHARHVLVSTRRWVVAFDCRS
jgi:hypothetical protein